ncbi:unnamed protein product [Paramecium sonneborni]|uniref:Uncharacterized protein n=1 Tax=Paramecium sonneborni TaxID=65129 RepID=A0A8S1JUU4_9CILI|nr:unnamed protein product [Paramecium sonneborni]
MNKLAGAKTYKNNQGQKSHRSYQSRLSEKVREQIHGLVTAMKKDKKYKKEEMRKYLKSENNKHIQNLD